MKLSDVFAALAYGELSQVVLGTHADGVITPVNIPALVNHINLGLTALYTRFNLKQQQMLFPLHPDAGTYQFNAPDLIKIERVIVDSGYDLSLNLEADPLSCFTPSLNVLRVPDKIMAKSADLPDVLKTDNLTVVYRANHPKLVLVAGAIDPATDLELPVSHLEALLFFVASRVNNPIGMGQEFNAGNTWFMKYENECQRLEGKGLQVDQSAESTRFNDRGWV